MTSDVILSPLMGRRDRLWPVVAISLAVHGAAIAFALFYKASEPVIDLNQKPIVAKLVRLGEKRPEKFLPRKDPTPAPPPPAPAVAVPSAHAPPAPPSKARSAAKPAPHSDPLASVLNKIRRDEVFHPDTNEGDPNGDPNGDSSDASEGDRYLALVTRALHDTYQVPSTISDRDRLYLKATVVLYILPDGRLARFQFEKKSGNPAFDDALDRAIRAARLPPPPNALREHYRSVGLGVNFKI